MNTNVQEIKKVLVTFSDSLAGYLKVEGERLFADITSRKDYVVFGLDYNAYVGDISNIPESNAEIWEQFLLENAEEKYGRCVRDIAKIISYGSSTTVEVFVNKNRASELCGFYHFVDKFNGLSDVYINYYHSVTREMTEFVNEFMIVDERVKLTNEIVEKLSSRWQKLALNKDAVIRGIVCGEIKEYSLEEAQNMILPVLDHKYKRYPRILIDFLDMYNTEQTIDFDCLSISYTLETLIKSGVAERTYKTDVQSGCSDIFFEQDFRLINKK